MLAHYTLRLFSFVLSVSAHISMSEVIEAHVRVINATCYDNILHMNDCSTYTLKIGYHRCIADDKLKPGNRFEYDYGIKYKFNSSIKTIFTQGLQKTGVDYLMVVVMNNNFKSSKPVTTCESTKDGSRDENRNSTVIHTQSYFSETLFYRFDIEIETVCHPSFCFGLRCDKCDKVTSALPASNRMTTQESSIEYITEDKTLSHSSRKVTSRHKTTTHSSRKVTSRHKTTTHSSRKVTSRHKTTTHSSRKVTSRHKTTTHRTRAITTIGSNRTNATFGKTDNVILLLLCLWSVYYF